MGSKRVLIVDDQSDMREMARIGMEIAGRWNALTASSGAEALRIAGAEQPDVILLDVMMPDMDGPTTFRHLHANPTTKHIPVILLTADEHAPFELGVIGTIAKPFNPFILAAQVTQVLEASA